MFPRQTHTYVDVPISRAAFDEIRDIIKKAYDGDARSLDHYFDGADAKDGIFGQGLRFTCEEPPRKASKGPLWGINAKLREKVRGRKRRVTRHVLFTVDAQDKAEAAFQFGHGVHLKHVKLGAQCELDFETLRRVSRKVQAERAKKAGERDVLATTEKKK